jgi:hypothetical protein
VDSAAWRVEPTSYRILVGPSSRGRDLLAADFAVK